MVVVETSTDDADDDDEDHMDDDDEDDDHERMEEVHEYCQCLEETCVPPNGRCGDYGRCCVEFVRDTNLIILTRLRKITWTHVDAVLKTKRALRIVHKKSIYRENGRMVKTGNTAIH